MSSVNFAYNTYDTTTFMNLFHPRVHLTPFYIVFCLPSKICTSFFGGLFGPRVYFFEHFSKILVVATLSLLSNCKILLYFLTTFFQISLPCHRPYVINKQQKIKVFLRTQKKNSERTQKKMVDRTL